MRTIAQIPLATGERKKLLLEFTSRGFGQAEFEELSKNDKRWALKFRDTAGAWHTKILVMHAHIFKADDLED